MAMFDEKWPVKTLWLAYGRVVEVAPLPALPMGEHTPSSFLDRMERP